VFNTMGLLFSVALITALFLGCVRWMQRKDDNDDADFEDGFALSLVPVAVGYAIAHYIGMGVFEGQQLLIQISDPFDRGWNLFGTAGEYVNYRFVGPTLIAVVQALGIVGGHVAGVMVGHDRALATLRRKEDLSGQVPLVLLLASFTAIALILLVEV
jgi:heme/copper-type cytochrome/quinol oxidase subunit 2